jgi:dTDP-glucose pyrophosphorylase
MRRWLATARDAANRLRRRGRGSSRVSADRVGGHAGIGPRAVATSPDVQRAIVPATGTIREAMSAIDRDVSRIALLVDDVGALVGTVTDGDARRAILAGIDLDSPANLIMATHPIVAEPGTPDEEIASLMLEHSIRQVPVVDDAGRVIDIKLLDLIAQPTEETVPVLIMAGGLGTRLGELTRQVPKPLVQVAGRPILATLVHDLVAQGFHTIILAVGHKAELIQDYFGDGGRFGANISYVREEQPLGTAGAIALALPRLEREFILTNADLLTRVNFGELITFHRQEKDDLTIAIIESTYQLRYGLVETEGSRVIGIREKPQLRHFVNAGIYVIQPHLASLVRRGTRFDMDELIRAAISAGHRVGCFPIHEFWADIGEPDDLRRASAAYGAGSDKALRRG